MLAINKIVLVIIFLIILALGIYVLFEMIWPMGGSFEAQAKLRLCCSNYRATGCSDISVTCNEETFETLSEIAAELKMGQSEVDSFCDCP